MEFNICKKHNRKMIKSDKWENGYRPRICEDCESEKEITIERIKQCNPNLKISIG